MSLDIYLTVKGHNNYRQPREAIFIRDKGRTREISREEWDALHPEREPVSAIISVNPEEVWHGNITHNMMQMANQAGLLEVMWVPDEIGITKAGDAMPLLSKGVRTLVEKKKELMALDPINEWGSWDLLLYTAASYLGACALFPNADITTSR